MTINDSLQQVLDRSDELSSLFYEVFFERCPDARVYFTDVNLKHQTVLLTMALMVIERHYTHGYGATVLYLKYLGHKHHLRQIPPEFYPRWTEAMLATLERFHGKDWDKTADGQWRAALDQAAQVMLGGYKEPVHV